MITKENLLQLAQQMGVDITSTESVQIATALAESTAQKHGYSMPVCFGKERNLDLCYPHPDEPSIKVYPCRDCAIKDLCEVPFESGVQFGSPVDELTDGEKTLALPEVMNPDLKKKKQRSKAPRRKRTSKIYFTPLSEHLGIKPGTEVDWAVKQIINGEIWTPKLVQSALDKQYPFSLTEPDEAEKIMKRNTRAAKSAVKKLREANLITCIEGNKKTWKSFQFITTGET